MMPVIVISREEENLLLNLANTTYMSSDTKEINQAEHDFVSLMANKYPKTFQKLEQFITNSDEFSLNTRKAFISLYKKSAQHLKILLIHQCRIDDDILSRHKKLLHTIQHAFDNQKIQSSIKHPISKVYVDIFTLFNPDNYERLIAKTKYYFNTKETQIALDILEIYHESNTPFRYKVQFYGPCLRVLVDYMFKTLETLNSVEDDFSQKFYNDLARHMALMKEIWCFMNFETYEIFFLQQLKDPKTFQVIELMTFNNFPQNLLEHTFQIAEHIISSLIRVKLANRFPDLIGLLSQMAQKEYNEIMQGKNDGIFLNRQLQGVNIAKIKFLIACSDCSFSQTPIIQFNPNFIDLYVRLIYPNFKAIQNYLSIHSKNTEQICNFLQDLSYGMQTECLQVVIQKLIISLCKSSTHTMANVRTMLNSFLFEYLAQISNGQIQETKNVPKNNMGVAFWQEISQHIDQKEQLISMLQFSALAVTLFLSDFQFLSALNKFMGKNSQFLLLSNPQISFYALLIYKNYKEDIFSDSRSSKFQVNFMSLVMEGENSILRQFGIFILMQFFEQRPPYDSVFMTIQSLFKTINHSFDQKLLPVVQAVFKNYTRQLSTIRETVPTIQAVMNNFALNVANNGLFHQNKIYFDILSHFLTIKEFSSSFPDLINKLFQIAQAIPNKGSIDGDELLFILMRGLKILGQLPPQTQSLLMKFKWSFESIDLINSLTDLLQYTQDQYFINWMFENLVNTDFSIHSCLLMHSILYYQAKRLNPNIFKPLIEKIYSFRMMNRLRFNYLNGKLNIILLLMKRFDGNMFHSFINESDWSYLQLPIRDELRLLEIFIKQKNVHSPPFPDQIYRLMYVSEHCYCWEYDIKLFLNIQIGFFQNEMNDQFQFKYANVSFVAVVKNILRAYEAINGNIDPQSQESDDGCMFPQKSSEIDIEYVNHHKITKEYHCPSQFNQDYFMLFRNLVTKLQKTPASKQWMKKIFESVFSHQDRRHIQQIVVSELIEGHKIRKIVTVNRQNI